MVYNYVVNKPHVSNTLCEIISWSQLVVSSCSQQKTQAHFKPSSDLVNPILLELLYDDTRPDFKNTF